MSYVSLLVLVQALAVGFMGKIREERRAMNSFLSGSMSSQSGLESQFSPGISSHNRPPGSRFEASKREPETSVPPFLFNILTSIFLLNKPCVLLFKSVAFPANSHKAQTSDLQTSPFSFATGRVVYGTVGLRLLGNAVFSHEREGKSFLFNSCFHLIRDYFYATSSMVFNTKYTIVSGSYNLIQMG